MTRLRIEIFPDDLDATADFYTRVLGFALVRDDRGAADEYLSLEWGDVVLGAARRRAVEHPEARRPPTGIEVVIEVDDVDALLVHVRAEGWPIEGDLRSQPWGLRDFRVLDPSGYYVRLTGL